MGSFVRWSTGVVLASSFLVGCPRAEDPRPGPDVPASPKWVGSNLEPMIVDWDPDQRQSLEVAMKQGVAVVEYGEAGFRLLRDCRVDGRYGYMGTTRRERVLHFDSADDIRANLPLGGLGLAAKLGGELQRGTTLDVAIVMVGQMRTTWREVTAKDLLGRCTGASHIVRGATLGAFAMDKGKRSQTRAAAEIFKIGGAFQQGSSQSLRNVDGSFDECAAAKPDGTAPPAQCGALVRLELEPLAREATGKEASATPKDEVATRNPCPSSFVFADGKCTRPTAAVIPECNYGDAAACRTACDAGRPLSCARLGVMALTGEGAPRAPRRGAEMVARACASDVGEACVVTGDVLAGGVEGVEKNPAEALKAYARGCDLGNGESCQRFGARALTGMGTPRNPELAARAMERGCNGGSKDACSDLGLVFLGGSPPFRVDLPRAAGLFKLACDGRSGVGCANLGYMTEFGQGVTKDAARAAAFYAKGCDLDATQCLWFAAMVHTGKIPGRAPDEKQATSLWQTACRAGSIPACAILRAYFDPRVALDMEVAQAYVNLWQGTCGSDLARDCTGLGVILLAGGRAQDGERALARGCALGDEWACLLGRRRHL